MKPSLNILAIILLFLISFSCERNVNKPVYNLYLDYLSDKSIVSIHILDDDVYVFSSKVCDTCYVSPVMSSIPMISQLTLINDSSFDFEEPTSFWIPAVSHQGSLYAASQNKIFKLNGIKNNELILETESFDFYYFAFDKNNNIWLGGYNGIAFWNGSELKVFNTSNSELPSNITHGLAIDNTDIVWIALDFEGVLKITGDKWDVISNIEIPGFKTSSYVRSPIVDNENNIWFTVFNSDTTSSILKYDGEDWNYEYPNQNGAGIINIDSHGTIWVSTNERENYSFKSSTLTYLQNEEWINFDVSMIGSYILTVNSDDETVYIGTAEGLKVMKK